MKRVQNISLALAAFVVMGALSGPAAFAALPEFKPAGGVFPVTFTSTSTVGLEPKFHGNAAGVAVTVTCTNAVDSGEISGAKNVHDVRIEYFGCKVGANGCKSGVAAGIITTKILKGEIGYIEGRTAKESGIELQPEAGTILTEFTCTGLPKAVAEGCVIGEGLPINVLQKTGELVFDENAAKTGQRWTKLEGKAACTFNMFAKPAWLTDKERETFSANVELKA